MKLVALSGQRTAAKLQQHNGGSKAARAVSAVVLPAAVSAAVLVAPAIAEGVSFQIGSGAEVANPVHLEFAVDGMSVRPAADGLIPGSGHFHVLIDLPAPPAGEAIPFDDARKHYGKGQTEADIALSPGKHTLVLQFANALHESYGPAYATTIDVDVRE